MSKLILNTIDHFTGLLLEEFDEKGTWLSDTFDLEQETIEGFYGGNSGIYYALESVKRVHNKTIKLPEVKVTDTNFFIHGLTGSFTNQFVFNIPVDLESIKVQPNSKFYDVISGYAGSILWCIYYARLENDSKYILKAEELATELINTCQIENIGISWRWPLRRKRNILGYSHGNAGIAQAFFELWDYTGNALYYDIGEEAFLYEEQFYNSEMNNWPDFRVDDDSDPQTSDSNKFMNCWCHGGNGIGIAYARIYEITQDEKYLNYALEAYKSQSQTGAGNLSLCHGVGGNIELFLTLFRVTGNKKYYQNAVDVLEAGINVNESLPQYLVGVNKENAKNKSLFLGYAGFIYACLRVLYPDKVENILYLNSNFKPKQQKLSEIYQFRSKQISSFSPIQKKTFEFISSQKNYETLLLEQSEQTEIISETDIIMISPKILLINEEDQSLLLYYSNGDFKLKNLGALSQILIESLESNTPMSLQHFLNNIANLIGKDLFLQIRESCIEQLQVFIQSGFIVREKVMEEVL